MISARSSDSESFDSVRVIIVHGMSDHCVGYAIGRERQPDAQAWLSPDTLSAVRIIPLNAPTQARIFADEIGVSGYDELPVYLRSRADAERYERDHPDEHHDAFVTVLTRSYDIELTHTERKRLDVSEITWSPMTQWLKGAVLGYDATHWVGPVLADDMSRIPSCVDPNTIVGNYRQPPRRQLLNDYLKWSLMDRALADAILYVGAYGQAMERGLSAAICRAVQGQSGDSGSCTWPDTLDPNVRYVFISHSLGGIMLFDTLQAISGNDSREAFKDSATLPSLSVACAFTRQTLGVYMMANQLAMLSLARFESAASKAKRQAAQNLRDPCVSDKETTARASIGPASPLVTQPKGRELSALLTIPPLTMTRLAAPLRVVGLNDTNDLLSWQIPKELPILTSAVTVSNLAVRNAPGFLTVLESPLDAHLLYDANPEVWRAIICGTGAGRVNDCLEGMEP
jgi:hypothetical protein